MNNNLRWFQWLAGDRKGEVLAFDSIETEGTDIFIKFKDGSRINENFVAQLNQTDVTGKFMAEVDHPSNTWTFKETYVGREEEIWETNADGEKVCVQPFTPGKKVINLVPPRLTPPTSSKFGVISNQVASPPPVINETPNNVPSITTANNKHLMTDPVYILLSKSKKIDLNIAMSLNVSLPAVSLYNIAKDSFEDGDKKFIDIIVDEIPSDDIKKSLREAIRQMYENGVSD